MSNHKTQKGAARKFFFDSLESLPRDGACIVWPFKTDHRGYGRIITPRERPRRTTSVHALALTIFAGDRPIGALATHGETCTSRACFNPNHLSWGTPTSNQVDRLRDGTHNRGERHPMVKLSQDEVYDIKFNFKDQSTVEVGAMFNVSYQTIGDIRAERTWAWLTEGV